jgi:hypothetical protein
MVAIFPDDKREILRRGNVRGGLIGACHRPGRSAVMAGLGILREYAKKSIPSPALPETVLFTHTDATLTIFDAYPKASRHLIENGTDLSIMLGKIPFPYYASLVTIYGIDQVQESPHSAPVGSRKGEGNY